MERLDFQDLYSKYSKPYEQYVYELAKKQDVKRVSELEQLSWAIVEEIVKKNKPVEGREIVSRRGQAEYNPAYR